MKEKIMIAIVASLLVFPAAALASVSCSDCAEGISCTCTITDCSSGFVDIFSSPTCAPTILYEYSFSGGSFNWIPALGSGGTYYMMAVCDDMVTKSVCSSPITVAVTGAESSTTSTSEINTEITTNTTGGGGGSNIVLYVLVLIIVVVIAYIAYRVFFKKGSSKKVDYEALYRKWGK